MYPKREAEGNLRHKRRQYEDKTMLHLKTGVMRPQTKEHWQPQELGEVRTDSPPGVQECSPANALTFRSDTDFGLLASRAMTE